MNANLAALAYLASGVLFILTLRGLSSPETSRGGNRLGMIGMALAVATVLATLWAQGALDGTTLALIVGLVVGRTLQPQHTAALAAFYGKTPASPLKANDGVTGWLFPYLVALVLDSPYFALR